MTLLKIGFETNAGYVGSGKDPNTGILYGNVLNEEQKRVVRRMQVLEMKSEC